MGTYLMMMYVSLEQEEAVKHFFIDKGWSFKKPDLSVTTDRTGPLTVQDTAETPAPTEIAQPVPTENVVEESLERTFNSNQSKTIQPRAKVKGGRKKVKAVVSEEQKTSSENTEYQQILQEAELITSSLSQSEPVLDQSGTMVDQSETVVDQSETLGEDDSFVTEVKVEHDSYLIKYDNDYDEAYDVEHSDDPETVTPFTCQSNIEGDSDTTLQIASDNNTVSPAAKKRRLSQRGKTSTTTLDEASTEAPVKTHDTSKRGRYRKSYTKQDLTDAYKAVFEEKIPVERAAKRFGVPINTLKDRVRGRVSVDTVKSGPSPLFSLEQETLLCNHLSTMAEIGYGYSRQETLNVASDYAHHLGLCGKSHRLSLQWLYNFLKRWPKLKGKAPRSLEIACVKSGTRPVIDAYFAELGRIRQTK